MSLDRAVQRTSLPRRCAVPASLIVLEGALWSALTSTLEPFLFGLACAPLVLLPCLFPFLLRGKTRLGSGIGIGLLVWLSAIVFMAAAACMASRLRDLIFEGPILEEGIVGCPLRLAPDAVIMTLALLCLAFPLAIQSTLLAMRKTTGAGWAWLLMPLALAGVLTLLLNTIEQLGGHVPWSQSSGVLVVFAIPRAVLPRLLGMLCLMVPGGLVMLLLNIVVHDPIRMLMEANGSADETRP